MSTDIVEHSIGVPQKTKKSDIIKTRNHDMMYTWKEIKSIYGENAM
jgi:hypothetical protein